MCVTDSGTPARPRDAGRAAGGPQPCPGSLSAIQLVDELGSPLANVTVRVLQTGATPQQMTTDGSGILCLNVPPGTTLDVEIPNIHEVRAGDSTTTGSGRHFRTASGGP